MPDKSRPKLPTVDRLTRVAIHYLERYNSSASNLKKLLERRVLKACRHHERDPGEFTEMIETVVEKCVKAGLVNDRTYAETKTASLRRRGGSRRKIEAQLSAKGVDRDTIQSVLNDDQASDAEAANVYARRRRLGPFRKSADRIERRDRDLAAMCRAGFAFDIARRVIDASDEDEGT